MSWLLKLATGNPVTLLWIAGAIAVASAAAGGSGAWTVQGFRLDAARAEYTAFKVQAKAAGDVQNVKAKAEDAVNAQRKENADVQNIQAKHSLADRYAAARKLRVERAGTGSGLLPSVPAGAPGPARSCFDRTALDRGLAVADGVLQTGAEKILQRGDAAVVDLNTAKTWAQAPGAAAVASDMQPPVASPNQLSDTRSTTP
jgi:hypothetical protein